MKQKAKRPTAQAQNNVLERIKSLAKSIVKAVDSGEFPQVEIPARTTSNIEYNPEIRQYVLGPRRVVRTAKNIKHLRPLAQLCWMAMFASQLITSKKTSTLRDAFYNALGYDVDFEDQQESDEAVTELETLVGTVREDFNIYPEERSSIFGPLVIEYTVPGYEGRSLDLRTIPDGAMIGPAMTTARIVRCQAEQVFVVEKGAIYQRFLEENVPQKYKAIVVHTAGQAPRATRKFIRRLNQEMNLPVYIFSDADPWGMHIASVIIFGSALSAHVRELNVPDGVWAGLWASDITRYKLPAMKFNEEDVRRVAELEKDPRYVQDPWKREIGQFKKMQRKAELESLSRYGLEYIVTDYLPEKLAEVTRK
ncbi:MAG: DNA topoisomerase IV subunit A [Candidatus Caldarchaeum sp.]|nr:DNA topoisomerase IV subunit A [Candidatus Caldarchaeum sp.]MCS7136867.1 DNA topoisomerase IV subunit A [Candidatus Caldarchaeum sp.]MDW7977619.1 DNA topoisomerase IV subunit A [Candidatus Caldarchaeum sp.]MDW8360245.1 DNA topoisomerase IV subunit A [Candidatus Caldarchaeum sp.]